jgi:hypothetical protein
MVKRLWRPAALVVMVLALAAVGTAVGAPKKAPKKATVTIKSPIKIKINKYFQDGARFAPGKVVIASGGTLTVKNKGGAPHTFSIVTKKQLPKGTKGVLNCGAPGTICETLGTAHQFDQNGNPTKPVVDVGAAGIDQPGDSYVLGPKQTLKLNVSAAKGKTLYFICGIHPWMQGQLKTR